MATTPQEEAETEVTMEEIVALCKRRGFVFPSSEIYGGLGSTYDYGHYGVLLKTNVKNEWWRSMLQERDDIVALDSAILQSPKVWEASGHLAGFTDPLVQCLGKCKRRWREDHLREAVAAEGGDPDGEIKCPECGGDGVPFVWFADTRTLTGAARLLYAGVKRTRNGMEILTRNQDDALKNVAAYLGMNKGNLNVGFGGGGMPKDWDGKVTIEWVASNAPATP